MTGQLEQRLVPIGNFCFEDMFLLSNKPKPTSALPRHVNFYNIHNCTHTKYKYYESDFFNLHTALFEGLFDIKILGIMHCFVVFMVSVYEFLNMSQGLLFQKNL